MWRLHSFKHTGKGGLYKDLASILMFPKGVYNLSCIWREKDSRVRAFVTATVAAETPVAYI